MYDYLDHYGKRAIERQKAVYDKLAAQYYQLLSASDEGVFEITVRSQSGTITIPVDLKVGSGIASELAENFSLRVDKLESNLNTTVANLGVENRSTQREAEEKSLRRAAPTPSYALAQQAATPVAQAPVPQSARPRKATMKAVAGEAALVPMNSGSTAHAASRATNLPSA